MEFNLREKIIKVDFGDIYEYNKLQIAHKGDFTIQDFIESNLVLENNLVLKDVKTAIYKVIGPENLENENKSKMANFIKEVEEAIK